MESEEPTNDQGQESVEKDDGETTKPSEHVESSAQALEEEDKPLNENGVREQQPMDDNNDKTAVTESPETTDVNTTVDKTNQTTRANKRKFIEVDKSNDVNDVSDSTKSAEQKENVNSKDGKLSAVEELNVMGKGKRARIPNKRYSDIILTPNRKSTASKTMDTFDNKSAHQQEEESTSFEGDNKKAKESLQDIKYLKPFKYGWKRELVWRSTSNSQKKVGDIYYYSPDGKKLRSLREIADNLTNKNLTLDNFSFSKETLGIDDPEKEIVRNAKYGKNSDSASEDSMNSPALSPIPKKAEGKRSKKTASPKSMGSEIETTKTTSNRRRAAAAGVASIVEKEKEGVEEFSPSSKRASRMGSKRMRTPAAKKPKLTIKNDEATEEHTVLPQRTTTLRTSKPCQPCSIRCEGVTGIIPTLQCRTCLCLYHHECVGAKPNAGFTYICKNCQKDESSSSTSTSSVSLTAPPPPLTPINTLMSCAAATQPTNNNPSMPKLQRIPRTNSTDSAPILPPPLPASAKCPDSQSAKASSIGKTIPENYHPHQQSLVGSVTSWLPHNAKLVNSKEPTETPRPQYVEYIAGRKFLVIPKHNYMSVSSNTLSKSEDIILTPTNLHHNNDISISSASLGPSLVLSRREKCQTKCGEHGSKVGVDESRNVGLEGVVEHESSKEEDDDGDDESSQNSAILAATTPPKKRNLKLKSIAHAATADDKAGNKFMDNYLQNVCFGYNTLLHIFQYLKVQDLLRAGRVCTMWRDIASHPILWRTVRMKNSQVHSFEGLANTLKKHGTTYLDLRKMLLPSASDEIWPQFSEAIAKVDTLRKIELCRCPATVIEQLAVSNPNLEVVIAVTIKCESMNLDSLRSFRNIRELRLKSTSGFNVKSIDALKELTTLKTLSLTSLNELHKLNLEALAELTGLESLDLGECMNFPKSFGADVLAKLENLEKLRLEKGQGACHTFDILNAVKDLPRLEQLELVNFDIKSGFDRSLGACKNLKKLMIIPTYISQSATTNNMVLSGVLRLQGNLTHFVWGVTLELLRVTELFVDQCEDSANNKKEKKISGSADSIPVLKPVPDLTNGGEIPVASDPPQVEILPLPNLQKLLLGSLPTTRVKILKIPFHATWRQTLTDSV